MSEKPMSSKVIIPTLNDDQAPRALQPKAWPRPRGYANGMTAKGRLVVTGGVVGWDVMGQFPEGLAAQAKQTFQNILAILQEGGAAASDVVRLTWYVVSIEDYNKQLYNIGAAYRETFGRHYPAMAVVQVVRLVEPKALIEIEATAVVAE
jgi:enamine deaminase RidA (YjgF/YER057c/UK114 family)